MSLVLKAGHAQLAWRYSELHDLRGELIRATILALDALSAAQPQGRPERIDGLPSSMDRMRTDLRLAFDAEPETVEWMLAADRPAPQPNYDALPLAIPAGGLPDVVLNALSGLNWFVNHSDCDGFHSAGQCADICVWLNLIAGHVRAGWQERVRELARLYGARRVVCFLG